MVRLSQLSLVSLRDLVISFGPFVLVALGLLWLAYAILDPTPPRTVVLATGPDSGAYAEFGKRYADELARFGIKVELRNTAGAAENLHLLRDPSSGVDIAFVQTGAGDAIYAVDEEASREALVSLGNLFYEPVWVFYRAEAGRRVDPSGALNQLAQLSSMRINVGAEGSGAANLFFKLLNLNRLDPAQMKLDRLPPTPAVVALLAGELDALVFVSSPESPLVRMLLQTPGIQLLPFDQAQGYARRLPFVSAVTLPPGVIDLAQNIPPYEVRLVAAKAALVANQRLHPALVQLFVQAAQRIHGTTSWFGPLDEFPNARVAEFPLAKEADRFYRNGPPFLQRYLPFWLANLIDRMWVVLVSLIAVLIPLSRIVPPAYEFRIRSRVFRWYRRLREIENAAAEPNAKAEQLLRELDQLDAKVERISVPLSHADELYALRSHIDLVRKRLQGEGLSGESVSSGAQAA